MDELDMVRAIEQAPEDDAVRMVYSDWLLEWGQLAIPARMM